MLSGQTAVITGGAQGLGFAIAERFVAEGARVVLGDLDVDATEAATERLGGHAVAAAVRMRRHQRGRRRHVDLDGRRAVRWAGHHGEQRRHHPRRDDAQDDRGAVRPGHRGASQGHVERHAQRSGGHAGEQEWRDRQHVVAVGEGRAGRPDELFGRQSRDHRHDQGCGQGARPPWCAGERDRARD